VNEKEFQKCATVSQGVPKSEQAITKIMNKNDVCPGPSGSAILSTRCLRFIAVAGIATPSLFLFLALALRCQGAETSAAHSPGKIVLETSLPAEQLEQKMLALSEQGGGTVVLPKASTLTALLRATNYKGSPTQHALLIPEDVTLDLNGSTLLLDLRSGGYGVRLTSRSTLRNGTVRVIRSEGAGPTRILHSAISVGATYGDGGTVEHPSYFSNLEGWRMENLDVDQPFDHSAIQLMSEAAHGVITNIRIADSKVAPIGIGLDWGTVGPIRMADDSQKEMHRLFTENKIYATHPHDVLIQKIRVGRMTKNENDDGSVAIRTSGCYNITIEDVEVEEVGVGVALHCGDAGFEYSRPPDRKIGHAGYIIRNVKVFKAFRKGIIIDGFADNIYRAQQGYGAPVWVSPVTPGIDRPLIQNVWLRGSNFTGLYGILVKYSAGARLENLDVADFHTAIQIGTWTKDITIARARVHDNKVGFAVQTAEKKPENVILDHIEFYDNFHDFDNNGMKLTPADGVYKLGQ
jgi:hypothetical protein